MEVSRQELEDAIQRVLDWELESYKERMKQFEETLAVQERKVEEICRRLGL